MHIVRSLLLFMACAQIACLDLPFENEEFLDEQADEAGGPSRVYFFDGWFWHLPHPDLYRALDQIEAHLRSNHPGVFFERWHNSRYREVCSAIKALKDKPRRLIFIGHSFGAGGAMDMARCLDDRSTDLVISIDGFRRIESAYPIDIVPEFILRNDNFSEDQGGLPGKRNHRRADGSYRGITNTHIQLPAPNPFDEEAVQKFDPHYLIVNALTDGGTIQNLLDETLREAPRSRSANCVPGGRPPVR